MSQIQPTGKEVSDLRLLLSAYGLNGSNDFRVEYTTEILQGEFFPSLLTKVLTGQLDPKEVDEAAARPLCMSGVPSFVKAILKRRGFEGSPEKMENLSLLCGIELRRRVEHDVSSGNTPQGADNSL